MLAMLSSAVPNTMSMTAPMSDSHAFHILLVNRHVNSANLLKRMLQRQYRLTYMRNGQEALDWLTHETCDLVVVEAGTQPITGFDMLRAIRTSPNRCDLPVIFIADQSKSDDIARALSLGANDFLTRPLNMNVVQARISHQLALKQKMDEQKQTIERLRLTQEVKDEFLRIATHDLKNPLNNIRLAQFYLRDVIGQDEVAIKALEAIEDNVSLMNELVEDFLDTALLKNGKAELNFQRVDVEDVIWTVMAQYGAAANRKSITLLLDKTNGAAWADPARLTQIISNLLSNAIKYSPNGGCVTLSAEVRQDRVRVSIADEGAGIPEHERSQLFKAFTRLSNRPTGNESSSGLGLWIVKELTTLQKGEVGADFPLNGGSIFWVELPYVA